MYTKKLMNAIIDAREWAQWIVLDKLLRLYHKEVAKSKKIDVFAYQRFVKLTKECPTCELQRSAVDILSAGQQHAGPTVLAAPGIVRSAVQTILPPQFLMDELTDLVAKLKASSLSKSLDPVDQAKDGAPTMSEQVNTSPEKIFD